MANARVSVPIRPMYMVKIIINLPAILRLEVIPVDKPTVPKAEISSKSNPIKLFSGSVIERINVDININDIENKAME